MSDEIPRMRVFAGPNGSGKSQLKRYLPAQLLGVYLNADEIEARIRVTRTLDIRSYCPQATAEEVLNFFKDSAFLKNAGLGYECAGLEFGDGRLLFKSIEVNSYYASVAVDFIRQKFLVTRTSFTVETVMSHESKVEWLRAAQLNGFRTYLYYIATDDPAINVSRVKARVFRGGHAVPENRIISRYHRSIRLINRAIQFTNRAYIFDNSVEGRDHQWIAEITGGSNLELKSAEVPAWFHKAVMLKAKPLA